MPAGAYEGAPRDGVTYESVTHDGVTYEGAVAEPATREWCARSRGRLRALLVVSAAGIPGWALVFAFLDVFLDIDVTWLAYVLMTASMLGLGWWALIQPRYKRYWRVLQVYPWQRLDGVAQVADNGVPFFRLPVPDNPDKDVSIRVRFPDVRRWRRVLGENAKREVWFAGDPRIGGVLALPGPRGVSLVRQGGAAGAAERTDEARGGGPAIRDIGDEALRRARAAGFGDPRYDVAVRRGS
ncbi:hypothetical protein ACIQCJ_11265 [Streptomyces sp. NPDC093221]|uniref:hypothetical protein n=1 Tax=Streptomyces sp. NPDC093221 TaxID=3366032 RepID=UPI0038170D4D